MIVFCGYFLLFDLVFVCFEQFVDAIFYYDDNCVQIIHDLIISETQNAIAVSGQVGCALTNRPHLTSPIFVSKIGEEFRVVSSPKVARLWGRLGGGVFSIAMTTAFRSSMT